MTSSIDAGYRKLYQPVYPPLALSIPFTDALDKIVVIPPLTN